MKVLLIKLSILLLFLSIPEAQNTHNLTRDTKEFQGKASYISKSKMDLGTWGATLNAGQKKQIEARMKNRLEKTYILTFNKEESFFKEEEKLDAISGATDSWGKYFTPGDQYKNVKTKLLVQSQEFYGKSFLVKDTLQAIEWELSEETKQIGNYLCFKAIAYIPTEELTWYAFSWDKLAARENKLVAEKETLTAKNEVEVTAIEAWYSPQIPVSHGPLEYSGLPGLILEVSAGNTTLLCTELIINPDDKMTITASEKGKVVTKKEYQEIILVKMKEFREIRGGRSRR
jgi:GLPGLI family protein